MTFSRVLRPHLRDRDSCHLNVQLPALWQTDPPNQNQGHDSTRLGHANEKLFSVAKATPSEDFKTA